MSLVRRGLTGVITSLWRALRNNGRILIKTLLRKWLHRAMVAPARMRINGNFSDISLERLHLHSVSVNRVMSPSGAVDQESPLFETVTFSVARLTFYFLNNLLARSGMILLETLLSSSAFCCNNSERTTSCALPPASSPLLCTFYTPFKTLLAPPLIRQGGGPSPRKYANFCYLLPLPMVCYCDSMLDMGALLICRYTTFIT